MKQYSVHSLVTSALFAAGLATVNAEITEEEAARLGKDLTPLGGEMAGNADGTIPQVRGRYHQAVAGVQAG